jgi:hypothetical protein
VAVAVAFAFAWPWPWPSPSPSPPVSVAPSLADLDALTESKCRQGILNWVRLHHGGVKPDNFRWFAELTPTRDAVPVRAAFALERSLLR